LFAFPLEEAETMTKWIAAKRSRPMLWVLEKLLALGTKRFNALKGSVQVFNMEVEVDGSPMALELALAGDVRGLVSQQGQHVR
jgi:hypothetical protein